MICIISCKKENTIAELGKPVPNYKFSNILNSKQKEISLNDFKGKPVILEFWATWCGPCIPAMKKLDTLQKDFGDNIEIITVSNESNERLEKFIKSSKTSLRVVSDTTHSEFFKYKVIPHSIIIDKNGIVRAITSPEKINKKVIENLLANNEIDLKLKDDFYIDPNLKVEIIKTISNSDYSIELKGYDQEKRGGFKPLVDADGNTNGIEMWNTTIPRLYQNLFDIASPSRIIFKDSLSEDDFPYEKEHQYNFSIQVSDENQKRWREIGSRFLNENFDVNAKMGIESLECYVLKNVDNTIKQSDSESTEFMFMGTTLKTKKIKMSRLAEYLENFTPIPVLDKTNLNKEYDIHLEWQAEDPKTIHSELKKYGLELVRAEEKLPVEILEVYKKK
ncbi:redoxin domain-containing protein [Psychroserpens sp. XS_ASV72]|uniref:redoxin domain-containing protein n=1 Tax=Psychroserpens sp. XS_ASV72 TaxID=3241293 RepID=UPI0035171E78